MGGWRVTAWDAVLARGTVESGVGALPFDAAVADVADFRLGEEVDVRLVSRDGAFVVANVRPVGWRDPPAPTPRPDFGPLLDAMRAAIANRTISMSAFDGETLRLRIDPESYENERWLEFLGCVFIQMPFELEGVATVNAYASDDFARVSREVARHWPSLDAGLTVFRFEPTYFAAAAGYIVAHSARIV